MSTMDVDTSTPTPPSHATLERSTSLHSTTSLRSSSRSTTVRGRNKRLSSQVSSSASSIAASDKSLTSFPSFSPESPKPHRSITSPPSNRRKEPSFERALEKSRLNPRHDGNDDETLTVADLARLGAGPGNTLDTPKDPQTPRSALFEDTPISSQKIPGALHTANDDHIERLISRHGASGLVRMLATDLAQRDSQIAALRRKADERERALRKIIRECGLSNLELETRLRSVENETRSNRPSNARAESGLTDLMTDAMQDSVASGQNDTEATIRASNLALASGQASSGENSISNQNKGTFRTWKDFIWGGTGKRSSVASSTNGDAGGPPSVIRSNTISERRPGLQDDLFNPPQSEDSFGSGSVRSPSRTSSIQSLPSGTRKPSSGMASSLMRLVAGGAINTRETRDSDSTRGRSSSATQSRPPAARTSSATSTQTAYSNRSVSVQGGPKALMAMRRAAAPANGPTPVPRSTQQDRWDTMGGSPPGAKSPHQENFGPVEMDAILPPESQPPTLSHVYNHSTGEYLTDRFGFIYDQRRKKRQREATHMTRHIKKGSRQEMIHNGRPSISTPRTEETTETDREDRPGSPSSAEDRQDGDKPKGWQEYLKMATFPTELLSHTPTVGASSIEVLEGVDDNEPAPTESTDQPRSPGIITTDERGFVPVASTTTSVADAEASPATTPAESQVSVASAKDDAEPVKLLLQHMSELHDSLQRERTVRWNDFLRKVRAERKRDGEAAAAAALAVAEARYEQPSVILPEASLGDGELIGITGLGNKGKVGRAKRHELRNLVLGGIPVAFRAKVWSECSGATTLRVPGYYQDIISKSGEEDDPIVVSQIQMDINRTLTDNIFFRKGPGVNKLNEVLLAYARRNSDVGYCQGMNLIAANLLLILPSAEDAFWVLASIIENILPTGYYDHSLLASRADQQVLRQYVTEILPRLSAHLEDLSIELEALTFQWFLSVFTDCLSAEALFRVWDVVLCMGEGSTFLFQVALALLKLNETQLLGCENPAAVYTYINHQMTNHAISIDNMINASEALRRVVKSEDVEARRDQAIATEKETLKAREEANTQRKKGQSVGEGTVGSGTGSAAAGVNEAETPSDVVSTKSMEVAHPTIPEEE